MSEQLTEIKEQEKTTIKSLLDSENVKNRLESILGKRASTFATSVIQIAQSNKLLAKAEPNSIVGAAMTAATLNLPLNNNLGYAYIIPFGERQDNGSYIQKAQFQIGYKGFIQLALRSNQFKTIHTESVKIGEIESRDRLTGSIEFNFEDNDSKREKLQTIGYVAYFKLINGFEATLYMTIEELNKHGSKFSQTFKRGFGLWKDDFDSMAKKTVLKLLLSKYAPLSIDMQTAVQTDQASFNNVEDIEDITYVDNKVIEIDVEKERIISAIKGSKTQDELDFIRSQKEAQTEEYLSLIKEKQKELNKTNSNNK